MAHPQIAAFARLANGSAKMLRSIAGQKTLITRSHHDMGFDPVRDEILVFQNQLGAIMTFQAGADGDVAPIRMIQGPKTQFGFTNGRLALDPVNHEIYVPNNSNSVLVFPQDAEGDVAPIRVLRGPDTQLDGGGSSAITIDPVHNLLIISGRSMSWKDNVDAASLVIRGRSGRRGSLDGGSVGQIAIFERTASGNAKPLRLITGSKTYLTSHNQTLMTTYPPRGWIFAAVGGSDYGEIAEHSTNALVAIWSIYDNGDAPPRWTIGGPNGLLRQARGIAISPKHKAVFVSDKSLNAIFTFEFPELF